MYKTVVNSDNIVVEIDKQNMRITNFLNNHWHGDITIPLEVIMRFVNDTQISQEKFPDYENRTLDYFDIDDFSITMVCHLSGDEKPTYIQAANFEEAEEIWNSPDFDKYV